MGLDINKLRSFGSDGCAVMVGRVSGVASLLKVLHCINHRLALATAHAADNIPYLKRFKENSITIGQLGWQDYVLFRKF